MLCGCGSNDENTSKGETSSLTASQVLDKLEQSGLTESLDARADYGDEVFNDNCYSLYGASIDELSDGGIMYVSSGKLSDEISIISSETADCEKLLTERAQSRANDFEGYVPDEMQKAEKALVFECGGFEILVISDSSDEIKSKIESFY